MAIMLLLGYSLSTSALIQDDDVSCGPSLVALYKQVRNQNFILQLVI